MRSSVSLLPSHSTAIANTHCIIFFLFLVFFTNSHSALNITTLLSSYPDLSDFTRLLSSTTIPSDLSSRSSLTLLVVPNRLLRLPSSSSTSLPDSLRLHVLLQYLSPADLRRLPPSGTLVTTLLQTTGRALNTNGAVNLTLSPSGSVTVSSSASNATILSLLQTLPYNLSIFSVDALLLPPNLDLTATENRPPLGLNITRALIDAHNFNVFASMLSASGVAGEFENDEAGAGITVFVPTDWAFAGSSATEKLQSLPADKKAVVLKYHVLHSYYPLGSLESIVNPVQPTLATEDSGAGRFTLNITRVNGSAAIGTGIVQASITQTVFDQNPVAIFAVSRVLLPKEIFGKERGEESFNGAPPPEVGVPPENSLSGVEMPPARLVAPTGFGVEMRSTGGDGIDGKRGGFAAGVLFCVVLHLMMV
ncbi:hypothetical protein MRB53_025044 [Persea americana]|uniref:Uncharacterized protein n=1 Tax=Persea americana TaxID=3435 RepID=A0ACC2LE40_PERAE|nr:hypothetical protein MRB53_025044 [Persea americana]